MNARRRLYLGQGARRRSRVRTRCECAEWSGGKPCPWIGPQSETVVLSFVPHALRSAFETVPAPEHRRILSKRIRVYSECAELILERDSQWAEQIQDVP